MTPLPDAEQAWALRFSDPEAARRWALEAADDDLDRGAAQVVQSFLHWRADRLVESLQLALDAEPGLRARQQHVWLARALNQQSIVVSEIGDSGRALRLLHEQLALAQGAGDREMEGCAYNDIGVLLSWNDPERALAYFQQAFDALQGADPPFPAIQGVAALNIGEILVERGETGRGDALIERGGALLGEAQAWTFWPYYISLRAARLRREGRSDEAHHLIRAGLEQVWPGQDAAPDGPRELVKVLRCMAARIDLEDGRPDPALAWLAPLEGWQEARGEWLAELLELRARAQHQRGDHAAAYHAMARLLEVTRARHTRERDTQVKGLEVLHRTEEALRHSREAEQAAQQLRAHLLELQAVQQQLERLSVTDDLTGLHNRRQFDRDLAGMQVGDALLMVDIDHFKRINDTHGHAAGDLALQEVARALGGALRRGDRAYRYGGEEFALLLGGVGAGHVGALAERVRQVVAARPLSAIHGHVTVSVGAGVLGRGAGTPQEVAQAADRALYRAKQLGRDRSCVG